MKAKTRISVAVITYNQQDTIRQTLNSILAQKGDFDLELVIGEDCSTDSTRAICEEYAKAYPQLLPKGKGDSFASEWGSHTVDSTQYDLLKENTQANHKKPTEAESILWGILKGNNIGLHFRRQHIILDYIVDFICLEKGLVIELDGGYHNNPDQAEYDMQRTAHLKQLGYTELRFTNEELLTNPDSVIERIKCVASQLPSLHERAWNRLFIRLLPSSKNLGIMANTARVFEASTGDFISIIAGDDYYCDDHALEKQMTYMLSRPKVGVMAANGYNYYVLRDEKVPGLNQPFEAAQEPIKSYYFSSNHMEGVCLAPTGMMFRAELLHKYIDFAEILRRKLPVEDFPIQAILSQHTYFACLPDLLVTYRVYKESASFISYNHPRYLSYYKGLMDIRRYLNELFPADACTTEVQLAERMFTKEFYYYVFHGDFHAAKQLVASAPPELQNSKNLRRANQICMFRILFVAYHYYKQFSVRRSINNQL